ncbi:hypothetical protein B9479_003954 [Cryptococcus floricola]|uniref:Uncharacterized protein n=1 Tax=Cryptococcus floricola TaxID=2591691 RepID=A0A5D3AZ73_9TREE|nr:hypothetical protein B9479_003954 [Cryptococcus floricola]
MTEPRKIHDLAYIDIQHDTTAVFDDVEQGSVVKEDFWVSGYQTESTSVHGRVKVEYEDGGRISVTPRDGVQVDRITQSDFIVDISSLSISRRAVHFPKQVIHPPYKKKSDLDPPLQINDLSINPKTPHIVVGGPDGYCAILPTSISANVKKEAVKLEGHVGDVRSVQWFPSGEVILTASSDLSLRIFGLTGVNPRTFRGHTRAITSSLIIGVGKNVLSGSKDGTVRLWDVAQGKEVRQWAVGGNKLYPAEGLTLLEDPKSLKAVGLEGQERVLLVRTQEGVWVQPEEGEGWLVELEGQLSALALDKENGTLALGYKSGVIEVVEIARLAKEVYTGKRSTIRRNESPIYSLALVAASQTSESNLFVGTAAGLPCRLGIKTVADGFEVTVTNELAGWDAVGVECIQVGSDGSVWCGGGEGGVRRYVVA